MKIIYHVLFVIVSALLLSCNTIETVEHSSFIPEAYHMTFNDEFTSFDLDTEGNGSSKWASWWIGWEARHLQGNKDKAYKVDASFIGSGSEPIDVVLHELTDEGTLKLYGKVTPENKLGNVKYEPFKKEGFPFLGGMITAEKSCSQTYGYFDVRCRMQVSKSQHWAIWLIQDDNAWPPEIDMVEVVGHQPDMVHMTAHWGDDTNKKSNFQTFHNINTREFHNYSFEWTPDSMFWYLDGKEMKSMANFVDHPMYFMISPEIAGNWTGMPDSTTTWPMMCEIDYVRIYQKEVE